MNSAPIRAANKIAAGFLGYLASQPFPCPVGENGPKKPRGIEISFVIAPAGETQSKMRERSCEAGFGDTCFRCGLFSHSSALSRGLLLRAWFCEPIKFVPANFYFATEQGVRAFWLARGLREVCRTLIAERTTDSNDRAISFGRCPQGEKVNRGADTGL